MSALFKTELQAIPRMKMQVKHFPACVSSFLLTTDQGVEMMLPPFSSIYMKKSLQCASHEDEVHDTSDSSQVLMDGIRPQCRSQEQ